MPTALAEAGTTQFSHELFVRLRKATGHTQESFAREVGMSVYSLKNYESGRTTPAAWRLAVFADLFNVPVTAFFTGPGSGR